MRKLIESTLGSLDGVIGSPDRWSPFDEESRHPAPSRAAHSFRTRRRRADDRDQVVKHRERQDLAEYPGGEPIRALLR